MNRAKRKIMDIAISTYIIIGIISLGIGIGGMILTDIRMDLEYQGYYYLATNAGSPEAVSGFLDQYLTAVDDIHGYGALIWRNPSTDMDYQKQVVQSFKDRADDLSNREDLSTQRINVQLSFVELTEDMEWKQLSMVRWHVLHYNIWILVAQMFFAFVWWWTLILLFLIRDI